MAARGRVGGTGSGLLFFLCWGARHRARGTRHSRRGARSRGGPGTLQRLHQLKGLARVGLEERHALVGPLLAASHDPAGR